MVSKMRTTPIDSLDSFTPTPDATARRESTPIFEETALTTGAVSSLEGFNKGSEAEDSAYGSLVSNLSSLKDLRTDAFPTPAIRQGIDQVTDSAKDAVSKTLPEYVVTQTIDTARHQTFEDERQTLEALIERVIEDESSELITPDKVRLLGMAWDESNGDGNLEASLVVMIGALQESENYDIEGEAALQAFNKVKDRQLNKTEDHQTVDFDATLYDGFNTYYEDGLQRIRDEIYQTSEVRLLEDILEDSLAVYDTLEGSYASVAERQVVAGIIIQDAEKMLHATETHQQTSVKNNYPERDINTGLLLVEAIGATRSAHLTAGVPDSLTKGLRETIDELRSHHTFDPAETSTFTDQEARLAQLAQINELERILNAFELNPTLDPRRFVEQSTNLPQSKFTKRGIISDTRRETPSQSQRPQRVIELTNFAKQLAQF